MCIGDDVNGEGGDVCGESGCAENSFGFLSGDLDLEMILLGDLGPLRIGPV